MLRYSTDAGESADLPDRPLTIRTPVLGFVELDEREARLIAEPEFQRADRIKQLALTHYVYPGATHSRLLHTFTMFELGTQMLRRMEEKADGRFGTVAEWTRRRQLFRLCALYHDLGHGPFSHAAEETLFPFIEVNESGQLVQQQKKHEDYSVEIVTATDNAELIDRLFAKESITAADVARVLRKDQPGDPRLQMVEELIDSDMDVDKFAYLLDDSHFCGVTYGLYDHRRLIETARVWDGGARGLRYGIDDGGLQVAESVVLARYFMHLQVYYHRTRRVFDHILGEFLKRILPGGSYPVSLPEYLAWDDAAVMDQARGVLTAAPSSDTAKWADRIRNRKPLSRVFESRAGHMEERDRFMYLALKEALENEIDRRGLDRWSDVVGRDVHGQHPLQPATEAITILDRKGERAGTLLDQSKIMQALLHPILQLRVYADCPTVEVREDIRAYADEMRKDMESRLDESGL